MFRTSGKSACAIAIASFLLAMLAGTGTALAANPVVKTVPWVASNPLIPHDTFPSKQVTLKGTADIDGAGIIYTWDFGDGTPVASGTVSNMRVIEATHTYTGVVGTVYTARLTVQNTNIIAPNTGSKEYYVAMRAKSLPVEINVAIDEGLWYLHKSMVLYLADQGYWAYNYNTETPANLNAFFVNGHLETGAASNPYTDTVQRGMRRLFTLLTPYAISNQTYDAPILTVNPDSNGNGLGIYGYDSYNYSSGIFIDAIVASGTPNAITTTGPANVINRTYKDIVQDMVDFVVYSQTDTGTWMGGWGYGLSYNSDNSVNQWTVIGMLGANGWGGTVTVPAFVKTANRNSLNNTQNASGGFGYTNSTSPAWGPWGTTPAGMVQMVFDGIGRGNAQWDLTENYVRNNFCNSSTSSQVNIRAYYYGLFSFTKSMLLTPGGGIQFLANQPGSTNPIDWYAAEASAGAPCNGVARTLVNDQLTTGNWGLHNDYGYHTYFSTAWAIIMLNRTVFQSGVPVAVAVALPNPAVVGQTIILDGSGSFHQDAAKSIVKWEWDLNNDGVYDVLGLSATTSFGALGNYPVTLRVTDNAGTTATTVVTVLVTIPPIAPTASAGGPYNFCPQATPWFLDGSKSINPDDGQHQSGFPGDFIKSYGWDLNGDAVYTDATGAKPNVTAYFTGLGPGSYLIQLKVTDNTSLSFPASGQGDLSDTDSTVVHVYAGTDPQCAGCINNLAALGKNKQVQLTWKLVAGADHYNIYRSTINGGPYIKIGVATGTQTVYFDYTVTNGTTYYYVVRPAQLNNTETCQSNQASALPKLR